MITKSKKILSLALILCMCIGLFPAIPVYAEGEEPPQIPIYMDPSYSYAERAADLVGRLTPTQKGSQMHSENAPAIIPSMLGGGALNVPATVGVSNYTWWQEALHGYARGNVTNSNSYPQSASVGNTWNPDLYYTEASYIGDEIRERANKITTAGAPNIGNAVNLTMYSPTVNLHRDPRWGRNEESYSEDPFLMSKMGSAFIQGIQGMDRDGNPLDPEGRRKVNATTKHYVANNSERNRLAGGAETSLRALREYYAVPYRDTIQEADVSSVMEAYSTLNGDPCSWSSYLIETLLRQTYGFTGYMTGDCDSVSTIKRHNFTNPYTGKVLTTVEQLSQALAHGMDLQCSGGHSSGTGHYGSNISNMLAQAVTTDKGKFTENQVDVSLHRLYTARMQTGEWDANNPYTSAAAARIAEQTGSIGWQTPERLQMIDDVNAEAVIMLKNEIPAGTEDKILPLAIPDSGEYKVVIVGAWQTNAYLGLYSAGQSDNTNLINIQQRIVSNIKGENPEATFTYLTNYGNSSSANSYTLSEADQATIAAADAVIVVTGTDHDYSKEDGDRTSIVFSNGQATLISNVGKLNPKTIAVMETCGPMQVTQFENDVAAILWSSYLGNRKVGFGDVITGKVNPSGKTTDTWYKTVSDTGASDIPSIYDYDLLPSEGKQGRTYMYYTGTPSYPFGYGLSYTTFEYSNLTIKKGASASTAFDANDTVTVSFDVTNTGDVKGKETTQLYVAQPDAPAELVRPIKRLQGFDKIELEPNETKTVTVDVKIPDLAFYDEGTDKFIVDTGAYEIQVGGSSADVPLKGIINVSGSMTMVPAVVTAKPSQPGDEVLGVEERLIFDKDQIVDPKLTVAMNDESLWGYIIKQQSSHVKQKTSTPFPEGMTFSYTSNRPSVVSVADGIIKTEGPGVATITATATYNGVSASGDFVVYVVSTPYIDDIQVDGISIPGFKPDRMNYSITVPEGTTTVPEIVPINTNTDVEVTYEQLTSIPGVMSIACTNTITDATVTYRVGVGYMPVTTDFKEGEAAALAKGWSFLNQSTNAVFDGAGLTITTTRGAFTNAAYQPQNVFMQPGLGDWVAQTRVSFAAAPTTNNQQAGLIIYDDAKNYIRFVYERSSSGTNVRVYNAVNGTETRSNTATVASQTSVYFQILKQADTYTFKYSLNGTAWTTFGTTSIASYAFPQLGLYATNGDTSVAAISATYENLTISNVSDLNPRLASLSVDGSQVAGFDPNKFAYNIEVAEDATVVPVLEATAANPTHTVTFNQLSTAKGTATVTVSTQADSATYSVSFNTTPVSDYFADGTIGPKWTVLNENTATYSVDKGLGLRLPTQRYDIYSNGTGWENVFVQPAMGNWEVVAKVFYPNKPTVNYQQAMLLVWQDDNNYIRLNCQTSSLTIEPGWENNGAMGGVAGGNAVANPDGTVTLYFRIVKDGTTYTLAYSQDGLNFTQLGNPITGVNFKDPKIGMFATQNSSGNQMNTYFEYLTITNRNGVQQKTYQQMLQDAVDHVRDYVAAGIPATTSSDIAFAKIPHGYTMSVVSSDPNVITNDGKINRTSETGGTTTLTVTISDSDGRTAVSEPITVTAKSVIPRLSMTGSDSVLPASSFTVGIGLNNVIQDVYAEDMTLSYDPAVFEYDTATGADLNVSILRAEPSDTGTLRILAANIGGITGDSAPILDVSFKVKDGVNDASSTISVTKAKLGVMPEGTVVQPVLTSKTISVGTTPIVDKSALQEAITEAQALYDNAPEGNEPGQYPAQAREAFLTAINAANAVYTNQDATQNEVDAAVSALAAAKVIFEAAVIPSQGVDKSELEDAIEAAQVQYTNAPEGNDPGQYPADARATFLVAINAANAVYTNQDATQNEVNAAVTALATAKGIFEASVISIPVDKSVLEDAIEAAQALYDSAVVGIDNGCYRQADKAAFQLAITTANAVYTNATASQTEVDNATTTLNLAKAVFEASVITASTGDINNSSSIDVGDLAIIAYYYGAVLGDENWEAAKVADINHDGKVDIEDLAFIAARIED